MQRTCPSCGAQETEDSPCTACTLLGAFESLGFDDSVATQSTFSPIDLASTFGYYRVEREIAGGGMGMVYEATDTRLGRPVALKMLRQVFFATELDRVQFQKEAELTSILDHPHIVPIYDVGEVDGQLYLAMKVIQGASLADHLVENPC